MTYVLPNSSTAGADQGIAECLEPLARLVCGKGYEAAKRAVVAQVGSVARGERFPDDVADAVFLRLQRVAQIGQYTDEKALEYRGAKRLEGAGSIKLYRCAPPGVGIRPGDFAAGTKEEVGFYKHGKNVVQTSTVPRRDVIAVKGNCGGGQEYVLLPEGYVAPTPIEHYRSFRAFFDAANRAVAHQSALAGENSNRESPELGASLRDPRPPATSAAAQRAALALQCVAGELAVRRRVHP